MKTICNGLQDFLDIFTLLRIYDWIYDLHELHHCSQYIYIYFPFVLIFINIKYIHLYSHQLQ